MTTTTLKTNAPRFALRLRAGTIDRRLLAGEDPLGSPELTARSERLVDAGHRRRLAQSLRHVVDVAQKPRRRPSSRIPVRREEIAGAREEIITLAQELEGPAEVSVRGVIMASRLIEDGAGSPLYRGEERGAVAAAARHARIALQLG